ncbi:MAG: hypothetical protein R3C97_11200 [Geminicoccaceae bacterium]
MLRLEPAWNDELWQAIEAMPLEADDRPLSFVRRLARENGWTPDHAHRSIEEYKRFVYLAMRAPHPVTPSEDVDQVWHLHLTYTASYWQDMCGKVLGRPLHHNPTDGGEVEDRKFVEQYKRTLASYERAFEAEPPADIWPSAEQRFSGAGELLWIDRSRYWLVRKPDKVLAGGAGLAALALFAGIAPGIAETGSSSSSTSSSPWYQPWILFGILAWIIVKIVQALHSIDKRKGRKKGGGSGGGSGCGAAGCGSSGCGSGCGGGGGGCGS